ncbi:MAG: acyl-CoA thioesterase [Pleurocapsa sp.]
MAFTYLRRVYLGDTDAAGVVYFTKGLEICHEAYEESLSKAGISLMQMINQGKTALPIVHAEVDFLRPLFCGYELQVNLVASQVNDSEFAIAYQISPVNNLDQILVKAQTKHVCINPQIRKRIDLPQAILEWVNYF